MTTMHFTTEQAVTRGAQWLDDNYPGWVDQVQLGALEVSDCNRCVLGQVWTGCIPEGEQSQILAQIIGANGPISPNLLSWTDTYQGGFNILSAHHFGSTIEASKELAEMGFLEYSCYDCDCPYAYGECAPTYADLTEAWTVLIIQRRLDAHADVELGSSRLASIGKELVTV